MRKRLDIQEALGKPTKVRRTMRIFLSNTAADQTSQLDEANNFDLNNENAPSWTLKIEGRLLDVSSQVKKKKKVENLIVFISL